MRVELSRFVETDLEEIGDWIAEDNPRRAITFVQEIRDVFDKIGRNPLIYRLRPEIGDDARMAIFGRYVILFWIDNGAVRIERVVFGGRELPPLFQQ